jgi:hypothetical protein
MPKEQKMPVTIDESLIYAVKRHVPEGRLTPDDCIAINLLWRKGVRARILAKVFNCSKNTIYYRSLTGNADSYPTSPRSNTAADTNRLIENLGVEGAWNKYVSQELADKVNAEMRAEAKRRSLGRPRR